MTNIIKVTHRRIDSVWTISFINVSDDEIQIVAYNRDDHEGYEKERELGKGHLIEADTPSPRTVVEALINGVKKKVVNPQFIFSYGA